MKLKGLLFRKLKEMEKEKKKREVELPGIKIKERTHIVEIPKVKDETKINITYPLIEMFAYAHIYWDDEKKHLVYEVIEPKLSRDEKSKLKKISDALIDLVEVELGAVKEEKRVMEYLQEQVKKVLKEFGITLTPAEYVKIMYYIYRDFIGLGKIEPLMRDPLLEDIGCDGVKIPIYVVHRNFGSIKTNVVFDEWDKLREFVIKLAEKCGRYVSYAEPILDATLPDGSRVAATLAGDIATKGPTFSIRKFRERPFSPPEQVELKTASAEILAYFWYLIEHRASILIAGGVATGKTSFLNSICMFMPPENKIVSIEDTRELMLPHEHWIPSVTRVGFGIPMPTGEKYGEVTLFDLLKESFRQNPDYVIVGEVRGKEAYVMFQGISSGNPCISTFHAGSVDAIVKRLITPPIELPPSLVETLDCIVIMIHAKEKGKAARRVKEIFEIRSVDESGRINGVKVFEWDPITDTHKMVSRSFAIEKLAKARGEPVENAYREIEIRKKVIEWMVRNGVKNYLEVSKIVNSYYKERNSLLQRIGVEIPKEIKIPTAIPEEIIKPKEIVEAELAEKKVPEKKEIPEKKERREEKKEEVKKEKKEVKPKKVEVPKKKRKMIEEIVSAFGFKLLKEKSKEK